MDREPDPRPAEDRDAYQTPVLARHGSLEELTAGNSKANQQSTDQQSLPPTD